MKNTKLLAWITLFASVIAFSVAAFAGKSDSYFNFQVGDTKLWDEGGQDCLSGIPWMKKEQIVRMEKKGDATYVYTNEQKKAKYVINENRVSYYDKQANVSQVIGLTEMGVGTTWDDTITLSGKNYDLKWRCDGYKTISIPPIDPDPCCPGREGAKCRRAMKKLKTKSYKALYCDVVSLNCDSASDDDTLQLCLSIFSDMYYVKGIGLVEFGEGEEEVFLWKYKPAKRK